MMRSSRTQDSFWKRALGIASANFFTAHYLTPLAKSGYIAVAGGEKNRYLPGKQYRILGVLYTEMNKGQRLIAEKFGLSVPTC